MRSEDIRYLRDKAVYFRHLATTYGSELTEALLRLADEFENKAAEIAARTGTAPG